MSTRKNQAHEMLNMKLSFQKITRCSFLVFLFCAGCWVSTAADDTADTCEPGTYQSDLCPNDSSPYLCQARFAPEDDGSCFSSGLCCCESRDLYFQSVCNKNDICCDGSCCDETTSFCCGSSCCEEESEVCCNSECVGQATIGTSILVPVIMNVSLAIIGYCMLCQAPDDDKARGGRFGIFMLFTTLWGVVQMVVARSAWDCSQGLKIVFWIGAAEAGLGFLVVFFKIIKAAISGEGVFAAFTLERLVVAVVDQEGTIQGVVVSDQQQLQVVREHMARNEAA